MILEDKKKLEPTKFSQDLFLSAWGCFKSIFLFWKVLESFGNRPKYKIACSDEPVHPV